MSTEEIKALAFVLIEMILANPFEYNENREDTLTLGAIYGVVSAVKAICEKEEQK